MASMQVTVLMDQASNQYTVAQLQQDVAKVLQSEGLAMKAASYLTLCAVQAEEGWTLRDVSRKVHSTNRKHTCDDFVLSANMVHRKAQCISPLGCSSTKAEKHTLFSLLFSACTLCWSVAAAAQLIVTVLCSFAGADRFARRCFTAAAAFSGRYCSAGASVAG